MDLKRAIDLLKTINEIDLYLEFLQLSEECELEKTVTVKNHPDKKESINLELTKGQVLLFYAWLKEERTKMQQLYEMYDEDTRMKAWDMYKVNAYV